MWVLKQRQGLWHYHSGAPSGIALCGSMLPGLETARRQDAKPNGFDGLLCNRCWFRQELEQTLGALTLDSDRSWLETLDFGTLAEPETDRLYAVIGEERADILRIIYSLSASSDVESEEPAESIVIVPDRPPISELTAIPLLMRLPAVPEVNEQDEEPAAALSQPGPRLKISCSRIPKEKSPSRLHTLFRRRQPE